MILDDGKSRCDGCGKTGKNWSAAGKRPNSKIVTVRGCIGLEEGNSLRVGSFPVLSQAAINSRNDSNFHKSFDFCAGSQKCFAKAAIKAAQSYNRVFFGKKK